MPLTQHTVPRLSLGIHLKVGVALARLGIQAADDIRSEITSLSLPANSPVTIAIKGSSNPLIDTGEMRAAVTHQVST